MDPTVRTPVKLAYPHYWSTACMHGEHGRCRRSCIWCEARCRCWCHRLPPPEDATVGP